MLTVAAAPFRMPKAFTIGGGMRSCGWLILKFSRERSVWAPQYLSAGTLISPKASLSVRVDAMVGVCENWRRWEVWDWNADNREAVERALWAGSGRQENGVTAKVEGLHLACASNRKARASAGRGFGRALRNMAIGARGGGGNV
jgi:hypothetical protein